ncbi:MULTISPECIES: flavodoxin domain-containing protein [unclassified Beijerinckia]|uniref:flavodoxin domain-containing protein n=1 Tax=unclassified Beijerinckia TaxID=2638183 RepID=UPI0008942759|nr:MULTISPECIES: flavodoxin domain-containing protein [unclassified Beijerinckia]MDH7797723.1 MioC protein [Beijerinckia sp. GAS462]SEC96356.1 MioC protein [Beijerinckia sp. 28-YEA-48]
MSETITILVATMGGTAEMVAETVAERIEDAGLSARILRMEKLKEPVTALGHGGRWVICSSTYGTGDVPDNGKALYTTLEDQRPDLSGLHYGVIALGDSIYPNTFCFGGKKFDALFSALGATRIGERLEHDARGADYPEDLATAWADTWLELVRDAG